MSTPDPDPPRRRRWLVPLLVASLGVNLVIVGAALSGQFWPGHGERKGYQRSADLMPRSFFRELDEERRGELVEVFRTRRSEYRDERRALGEAAAAFADALERDPFDPQLAQSAIEEHTARSRRLVDLGATAAADLVGAMNAEERRTLARTIRDRLEHARQRRDRRSR